MQARALLRAVLERDPALAASSPACTTPVSARRGPRPASRGLPAPRVRLGRPAAALQHPPALRRRLDRRVHRRRSPGAQAPRTSRRPAPSQLTRTGPDPSCATSISFATGVQGSPVRRADRSSPAVPLRSALRDPVTARPSTGPGVGAAARRSPREAGRPCWPAAPTTCATPACRPGWPPASPRAGSPTGPVTASPSCFGSTPTPSTEKTRSPGAASPRPS